MRILMLDLDTLRPDHLGCYGYPRPTSPAIDSVAKDGVRFENYHCSDAPCLPSRAALTTGRFGIRNGVVGHGGTAADLKLEGCGRGFRSRLLEDGFFNIFRKAGMRVASVNSFAERHSAFWFNAGVNEQYNCGGGGTESAEEVTPLVLDWLDRNMEKDNWFLHVNYWDAHTPYRAPASFGDPFQDDPIPGWITEEVYEKHRRHIGPHSIREIDMYDSKFDPRYPRQPGSVERYEDLRLVMDGYDCGVRYMDGHIGRIFEKLKQAGIYDDTAILITADHGENLGELGIYCEHATADEATTRIPMILKWPGVSPRVRRGLYYNIDLLPTLAQLLGTESSNGWDGKSYCSALRKGVDSGRPYLVVSQCAHVCQRSVRFGHYLYIRTYHGGFHLFPREMLFDLERDSHEQYNLAEQNPAICADACRSLCEWHDAMMQKNDAASDPLWTVIREGGPHHVKGYLETYCRQLEATGRAEGAAKLRQIYR